jgi:hypothetical protein
MFSTLTVESESKIVAPIRLLLTFLLPVTYVLSISKIFIPKALVKKILVH